MCGRFAQSQTREDYLALLAEDIERDIPYDPEPIGRYNVAPGTKVLLLSERDEHLHLDPVFWGYAPGWWDKSPLINARWYCRQKLRGNGCGKTLVVKKPQKSLPVAVCQQTSSPGTRYRAR